MFKNIYKVSKIIPQICSRNAQLPFLTCFRNYGKQLLYHNGSLYIKIFNKFDFQLLHLNVFTKNQTFCKVMDDLRSLWTARNSKLPMDKFLLLKVNLWQWQLLRNGMHKKISLTDLRCI